MFSGILRFNFFVLFSFQFNSFDLVVTIFSYNAPPSSGQKIRISHCFGVDVWLQWSTPKCQTFFFFFPCSILRSIDHKYYIKIEGCVAHRLNIIHAKKILPWKYWGWIWFDPNLQHSPDSLTSLTTFVLYIQYMHAVMTALQSILPEIGIRFVGVALLSGRGILTQGSLTLLILLGNFQEK